MKRNILNSHLLQNILYILFSTLSLIISIIVGALYNYDFFYSYLLSFVFVVLTLIFIILFDQLPFKNIEKLKEKSRKHRWKIVFMWKVKYLPIIFYLIFCILIIDKNIFFINTLGLCYGAIILVIIILVSEFLRVSFASFEISKIGKEVIN